MTNRSARFTQTGIERAIRTWTDAEIAKYEAVLPVDSKRSMSRQRAQITDQIDAVKIERFRKAPELLAFIDEIAGRVAA
jgi:hypothetical protein